MKQRTRKTFPIHPFLLAIASVVSLLSVNKAEVQPIAAVRLIMVMLLVSALGYLFNLLLFRNRDKAALLTTVILLLFTTYGRVFSLMQNYRSLAFLTRHRYVLVLYVIILIISIIFIVRTRKPEKFTWPLNLIMGIALAIPFFQVANFYIAESNVSPSQDHENSTINQDIVLSGEDKPDIYYIILDSYGREDALVDFYDFDNSSFLDSLRERGFFVGDCSRSNYGHTRLSLSSSLNMNYLDKLGVDFDPQTRSLPELDPLLRKNSVARILSDHGYKTITFETGYRFTEITDSDIYYKSQSNLLFSPFIEPFEYLFIESSPFKVIIDTEYGPLYTPFKRLTFPFTAQKENVQNAFKTLPLIPDIEGPKFVFVYLPIPHHPFIFLPDGSINPDSKYYPNFLTVPLDIKIMAEGYINQVKYVNAEILPIVDEILQKSKTPPIIILQGDHGLQGGDRMDILNAIYLPKGGEDVLCPSISPVNTFRVIFNQYFGTNLPYLEDIYYLSTSDDNLDLKVQGENYEHCIIK